MKKLIFIFILLFTNFILAEQKFVENVDMMGNIIKNVGQSENPSPTEVITYGFLQQYVNQSINELSYKFDDVTEERFVELEKKIYELTNDFVQSINLNNYVKKSGDVLNGNLDVNNNYLLNARFNVLAIGDSILSNDAANDVLELKNSGRFYSRDIICSNLLILDTNAWYIKVPFIFSNIVNFSYWPIRGVTNAIANDMPINYLQFTNVIGKIEKDLYMITNSINAATRDELQQAGQQIINWTIEYVDDRIDTSYLALLGYIDTNNIKLSDLIISNVLSIVSTNRINLSFTNNYVSKYGDRMFGVLNMGGNAISNVGNPTLSHHAATKEYVDISTNSLRQYVDVSFLRHSFTNSDNIQIGPNANGLNNGISIGRDSRGDFTGVGIGRSAMGQNSGVSIGFESVAYNIGVAVGYGAKGFVNGVSIGAYSHAVSNSSAIGFGVTNFIPNTLAIPFGMPTLSNHAATKGYVDITVTNVSYTISTNIASSYVNSATNALYNQISNEIMQAGSNIVNFCVGYTDDRVQTSYLAMLGFIDTNCVKVVGNKMTLLNIWDNNTNKIYSISPNGRYTNLISFTIGE